MDAATERRLLRRSDLVHVTTEMPGITRRRRGRGFAYYAPDGTLIRDKAEIARLNKLAVPPAYREVWICPLANGHLQAVGRDDRGRLQYRYHAEWRRLRDRSKYTQLIEFGNALPRIRSKVSCDLVGPGLGRDRICAAVLRLLDVGHLRIGNAEYAEENDSYGATTLRHEHAVTEGTALKLRFVAKGGKQVRKKLSDRQLVRIVRRCHELPGQALFSYREDSGEVHPIRSDDVNVYLKTISGGVFTAKHFRTWWGSVLAYQGISERLRAGREPGSITLKEIVDPVAAVLVNTPAICRSSYIHPAIIEAVKNGTQTPEDFTGWPPRTKYLEAPEHGLLQFLERSARRRGARNL